MEIIIWKERIHINVYSHPHTSSYSSIINMNFLPMFPSLGNMWSGGLAMHPCRRWAQRQHSTVHVCLCEYSEAAVKSWLSCPNSSGETWVNKYIIFVCVWYMCSVSFVVCLSGYIAMCSYMDVPGSQSRMWGVFFHCSLPYCLATEYLAELETLFHLDWVWL